MPAVPNVDVLSASDLSDNDVWLWNSFVAARPDLQGPYFDLRYIRGIAADVPKSGIARFRDGGEIAGYFAFQRRSGVIQPLGAPLSDYHGVIAPVGFEPDFDALLQATGAKRLEVQGWVGPISERAAGVRLTRRQADASLGYEHWYATQDALHHKFFKNVARCQRNIDKDFGGFAFSWERVTPELLDWTLSLKRQQYRNSGMHDVFDCGWTHDVLASLAACGDETCGLRAGVFRHGGRIVATEISLLAGEDLHLWFPAYDTYYQRYSPGILLTIAIIRHLAPLGIKRFDFGTGGEDYKSPLTSAGGECFEGDLTMSTRTAPSLIATVVVPEVRLSVKRRLRIIRATETTLAGWGRAMTRLAERSVARLGRHIHSRLPAKAAITS